MKARCTIIAALVAVAMPALAFAQAGTFNVRQLTPETAAKATRAALDDAASAATRWPSRWSTAPAWLRP